MKRVLRAQLVVLSGLVLGGALYFVFPLIGIGILLGVVLAGLFALFALQKPEGELHSVNKKMNVALSIIHLS